MTERTTTRLPRAEGLRRVEMKGPDDVSAMLRLKALGWGARAVRWRLGSAVTLRAAGRRATIAARDPGVMSVWTTASART